MIDRPGGITLIPETYLPAHQAICGLHAYAFMAKLVDDQAKLQARLTEIREYVDYELTHSAPSTHFGDAAVMLANIKEMIGND